MTETQDGKKKWEKLQHSSQSSDDIIKYGAIRSCVGRAGVGWARETNWQ